MIWLIGSTGLLGSEVSRLFQKNKIPFTGTSSDVDVTDYNTLKKFASDWETKNYIQSHKNGAKSRIQWIVNCSGYTNVEKAEKEKSAVMAVNVDGSRNIARVARELGAKLIHISTDYVFDGTADSPYKESAKKNPLGVYALSKAAAEDEIQKAMTQYFILRISWLYGFDRMNFVYKMACLMESQEEIRVVNDQTGCPTFSADIAEAILMIIRISDRAGTNIFSRQGLPYGIYNFADSGQTTWFDYALQIQKLLLQHKRITNKCRIVPCSSSEFASKVQRPAYSVLDNEKISKALKIKIPKWQDSLEKFIRDERFMVP